jgi:hypothetical protein
MAMRVLEERPALSFLLSFLFLHSPNRLASTVGETLSPENRRETALTPIRM